MALKFNFLFPVLLWNIFMHASYEDFLRFADAEQANDHILKILYEEFFAHLSPSRQPELIAIGGSPGSGKTAFRKAFIKLDNAHLHDMVEVMVLLPGYQDDLKKIGATKTFEKWWPTARELAQILFQYAIESRYSIIYDRTCGSEGSYEDLLLVRERGYLIHLIGLYVDKDIARERILKREREEGRAMTEEICVEYRSRFSALWPYYLKLVDDATLYETNYEKPSLVYSSRDDSKKSPIYQAFLDEGEPFRDYFRQILLPL
jgi:predicted ABC-type ATPase